MDQLYEACIAAGLLHRIRKLGKIRKKKGRAFKAPPF
jgi:hypothetical protein